MIKNSTKQKKWKAFFAGKGFYIVLGCCVLAAGLTAWGAFSSQIGISGEDTPFVRTEDPTRATLDWSGGKQANVPATDVPDTRPAETQAPATQKETKPAEKFVLPAGPDICNDFSDGELVYSQTMNDWRAHNGIDFKCEVGGEIKAAAAGTVTKVINDTLWGIVIEIDHGNGMTARYCGLDKTPSVSEGMTVTAGQALGTLGTIPCEAQVESHLHFEMRVNGTLTDPLTALGMA